jgi:hypothetical protein
MSVTYTSVLPVRDDTVEFLAGLLAAVVPGSGLVLSAAAPV